VSSEKLTKTFRDLVGQARHRKGLSQANFGKLFNKSQGEISRYESGEVCPPSEILMHCMHELGLVTTQEPEVSSMQLAKLVEKRLTGEKHRLTRKLLLELIERLA
jgi:ribosome-binding protein aMBF1 (putative translation factor)